MNAVRLVSLLIVLSQVPVTGRAQGCFSFTAEEKFEKTIQAQHIPVQRVLGTIIDESEGYLVSGPLEPLANYGEFYGRVFSSVRVVCPDPEMKQKAIDKILASGDLAVTSSGTGNAVTKYFPGYTGTMLNLDFGGDQVMLQVLTLAELRYVLWFQYVRENGWYQQPADSRAQFALAISDYLKGLTYDNRLSEPPEASSYDLPGHLDLYPEIVGVTSIPKREYGQAIAACREISAEVAYGALVFVPGKVGVMGLKRLAPLRLYPEPVQAHMQDAYRNATNLDRPQTLTKTVFDALASGTYAFAVSAAGRIRIARMTDETDSNPIHARLLYGEQALAAGTIVIDTNRQPRLVQITAGSEYHFGPALESSPEEDLARTSDQVFLSLGHFLTALDRLGIDYSGVLISKF
ncbi:MAG: hypothetical protein ABIE70_02510 [bacterium]